MNKVHVRKDDTVIVISGKDKGVKGKVLAVSPDEGKVIVQGANIVKKHTKPRKQGEAGGILQVEGAMYASKVQIFCASCDKATRIKHKVVADVVDGKKKNKRIRVCAKCGKEL